MKKIFNILMLACLMLTAACSSEEEPTEASAQNGRKVVVSVAMPDENDTRVSINGTKMVWNEGDQVFILAMNEDGTLIDIKLLNIVSGVGTNVALFDGEVADAPKYKLVYKNENVKVVDDSISLDYSNISQTALDNEEHIKNSFIITSDAVTLANTIQMHLQNSVLKINLRSVPENITSITDVKWILNYGEADQTVAASVKFTGDLPILYTDEADRYLYMPIDVTKNLIQHAGKKMALQFNGSRTRTVTVTAPSEKKYIGNRMYTISVSLIPKQGVKEMNEWDAENDNLNDNQIWVLPMPSDPNRPYVMENIQNPEKISLRGYWVYNSKNSITSIPGGLSIGVRIKKIIFPKSLENINTNLQQIVSEEPVDFTKHNNINKINNSSLAYLKSKVLLPVNGKVDILPEYSFAFFFHDVAQVPSDNTIIIPVTIKRIEESFLYETFDRCSVLKFLADPDNLTIVEHTYSFYKVYTEKIELVLNKKYLTTTKTGLKPSKENGKFLWHGKEWKYIKFVNVNADGSMGDEYLEWSRNGEIEFDPNDGGSLDDGVLTSPGI